MNIWEIALTVALAFFALWVCGMTNKFYDFVVSFFPIKIKVKELTCWHFEREESPLSSLHHCHEYNFAGTISIIPRKSKVALEVKHLYLEARTDKGELLKVPHLSTPVFDSVLNKLCDHILIDEKETSNFSFQLRLPNEVNFLSYGYVVFKFNRGKAKSKVSIKRDDEYRPKIGERYR